MHKLPLGTHDINIARIVKYQNVDFNVANIGVIASLVTNNRCMVLRWTCYIWCYIQITNPSLHR